MKNSEELVDEAMARVNVVAMEALRELFHRMPFGTKIELANGKTATIKPFFEPRDGTEPDIDCPEKWKGVPCAGIDIQFDDGSGHLEFLLYQSGGGHAVGVTKHE